ncbi:hypothetical protein F1D05_33465 [Kribbella qitaiheensis]|uniref:Uncharacterized protein n=1 Tax=Kribbella qitaiheensis TaxID=1544730 RepID=A0A7G6X6R4_9ACTN|nr:hypothetical protein [Kribbella qitaiheensis]QNE21929.1 hypothetical protein F1D05_33465 [Kribbella qitaiheensis]
MIYPGTRTAYAGHRPVLLMAEVHQARSAAHDKHGDNSIEALAADSPRWLPVLVEEVGEIANTLTYDGPGDNTRAELIDAIAVLTAWLDAIDTARKPRTLATTGRN